MIIVDIIVTIRELTTTFIIANSALRGPRGPSLPKILYNIVPSLKFGEDCKIVITSPKQLLYVTHDVTCNHVIYRRFRTLNTKIYRLIFEIRVSH